MGRSSGNDGDADRRLKVLKAMHDQLSDLIEEADEIDEPMLAYLLDMARMETIDASGRTLAGGKST